MDLLGCKRMYAVMYENPAALECLLGKIQELFLAAIAPQIEAAGGEERITTTDFPEYWFPEGRKGHVSDDISANISPASYERFSRRFHDLVFQSYGGGGLHNCGPNPCLDGYLSHCPAPRSLDLDYTYSKKDLPRIKQVRRKKAFVYLGGFPARTGQGHAAFREIMELMAPDVIVVPHVSYRSRRAVEVYLRLREIAEEYAKRMDWGWDTAPGRGAVELVEIGPFQKSVCYFDSVAAFLEQAVTITHRVPKPSSTLRVEHNPIRLDSESQTTGASRYAA